MNAAFEFAAGPAARARIRGIFRHRGAGLAAYAEIALVVLRQMVESVAAGVIPNLAPGPIDEGVHLGEEFAGGQAMELDSFQVLACYGLFAAQAGEPGVKGLQSFHKRSNFAE